MNQLKERIIELRKHLGLNQKEFADAIGIGQSTLAMIETGKRNINQRHIKLILSAFNVNERWLLKGERSMFALQSGMYLYTTSKLTPIDNAIMNVFFELAPRNREIISDFILKVAEECGYTPPKGEQPNTNETT